MANTSDVHTPATISLTRIDYIMYSSTITDIIHPSSVDAPLLSTNEIGMSETIFNPTAISSRL